MGKFCPRFRPQPSALLILGLVPFCKEFGASHAFGTRPNQGYADESPYKPDPVSHMSPWEKITIHLVPRLLTESSDLPDSSNEQFSNAICLVLLLVGFT
jgi:hypothetical protein